MRLRPVHVVLIIAVLVAAAALLNPSAEQHRTKIRETVAERSQLATLLRLGDLTAFVSEYHSLGIASYTKVDDEVTSIGAFGVVTVLEGSEGR